MKTKEQGTMNTAQAMVTMVMLGWLVYYGFNFLEVGNYLQYLGKHELGLSGKALGIFSVFIVPVMIPVLGSNILVKLLESKENKNDNHENT